MELYAGQSAARNLTVTAVLLTLALAWFYAFMHAVLNGRGLLHVEIVNDLPEAGGASPVFLWTATGALAVVSAATLLSLIWWGRRQRRRAEAELEEAD